MLPPLVEPVAALSAEERARTARHASLAVLGEVGQRRIAAAHVAVVGAGGLGSPVVLALAAAGIGTLTIVDDDDVERTNLQRQVMHRHADVGRPKVDSATRVAADLSPETVVRTVPERITPENAVEVLRGADVVVDGTDTFDTREAVAAACETLGVPLVWGTVQEFDAQVTVFWSAPPAGVEPVVLADLYPPGSVGEVPTCAQVGVLGSLCLQVGAQLATETVKLVAGIGEPLLGRVLLIDGLRGRQHEIPLHAARAGDAVSAHGLADAGSPPAARSTRPADAASSPPASPESAPQGTGSPETRAVATTEPEIEELSVAGALAAQEAGATILDVREPYETADGVVPGAVLLPLAELLASPDGVGPGPFVVVCQAGIRATRAARALRAAGADAAVLAGGMLAWTRETGTGVPAGGAHAGPAAHHAATGRTTGRAAADGPATDADTALAHDAGDASPRTAHAPRTGSSPGPAR